MPTRPPSRAAVDLAEEERGASLAAITARNQAGSRPSTAARREIESLHVALRELETENEQLHMALRERTDAEKKVERDARLQQVILRTHAQASQAQAQLHKRNCDELACRLSAVRREVEAGSLPQQERRPPQEVPDGLRDRLKELLSMGGGNTTCTPGRPSFGRPLGKLEEHPAPRPTAEEAVAPPAGAPPRAPQEEAPPPEAAAVEEQGAAKSQLQRLRAKKGGLVISLGGDDDSELVIAPPSQTASTCMSTCTPVSFFPEDAAMASSAAEPAASSGRAPSRPASASAGREEAAPAAAEFCEPGELGLELRDNACLVAAVPVESPPADEDARRRSEEAAKKAADEEDVRKKAEEDARRKAAEEEAAKKAEEAAKKAAEDEDARRRSEEAAKKAADEEDVRKKAEEDARRKAAEEEAAKKAEEAAKKAAEDEDARRRSEEAAKKAADEEDIRKKAEEDAKRKAAEEEKALKDAEEAAKKAADEEDARKAAEEAAKKRAAEEEENQKKAEEADDEGEKELVQKEADDEGEQDLVQEEHSDEDAEVLITEVETSAEVRGRLLAFRCLDYEAPEELGTLAASDDVAGLLPQANGSPRSGPKLGPLHRTRTAPSDNSGLWRSPSSAGRDPRSAPARGASVPAFCEDSAEQPPPTQTREPASTRSFGALHQTANGYKRLSTASGAISREQQLKRCVQSLLNKICPENVHKIAARIKEESKIQNVDELQLVIGLVFKKSLAEPHYCESYADLVYYLQTEMPEFLPDGEVKPVTFKSTLVNVCQDEFENMPRTLAPTPGEATQCDADELQFKQGQQKARILANMKLIGHLFLRQLLPTKIIAWVIQELLMVDSADAPEEHVVECVCEVLNAIGYTLEQKTVGKATIAQVCGRMLDLQQRKTNEGKGFYSKRIQFAIQDLLDTRKAGWTRKVFKIAAKTKEEIRHEQERQIRAQTAGKNVSVAEVVVAGQRPAYLDDIHTKQTNADVDQKAVEEVWQECTKSKTRCR